MLQIQVKLIISILLSDIIFIYSEAFSGATTENLVVTLKDYFNSEQLAAAFNKDNQSEPAKDIPQPNARIIFDRTARARTTISTKELFTCAISMDASCLVDGVEDMVDNANDNLMEQADAEARRMFVGRADSGEEAPSTLIASIAQMVMELPELLKDGLGGMFRSEQGIGETEEEDELDSETEDEEKEGDGEDETNGEEEDDDDEDEEEEEEDEAKDDETKKQVEAKESTDSDEDGRKKCGKKGHCGTGGGHNGNAGNNNGGDYSDYGFASHIHGTTGRHTGGARGKKKKKKKAIVKLLLLGLIIKAKITLLLKLLAAKLQIKFLIIAIANLLLNLARFWWDLKKGHGHEQPQKVIYYEHAQHQHHYDGGEDWESSPGGGGGYWGRAYENEDKGGKDAQDIAYSKQIPRGGAYTRVDAKPNIPSNPFG